MAKRKPGKSAICSNNLELTTITPLTPAQEEFFENYSSGKSQILLGYPGTGKTMLSMYKSLEQLINNPEYRQLVIVRSAVPTRDIGFLPGSEMEKSEVYELPYKKICSDLFGRDDAYEILKKHNIIKFMTTSFVRGITLDDTILIVDECQSLNGHELSSIVTRIGSNAKILFCGDFAQTDLTKSSERSGAPNFFSVLQNLPNHFSFNSFGEEDIVRSGLVKDFIKALYKQFPSGTI